MNNKPKAIRTKIAVANPLRSMPLIAIPHLSDDERRAQVWELRLKGYSYEAISNELLQRHGYELLPKGWSARHVYDDASFVLSKVNSEYRENAAEMVEIEKQRFDKMLSVVWEQAERGDLQAMDRVLAISKERRKMLGLDNPDRIQVDWRVQLVSLLTNGTITPGQIAAEFGDEALIEVNRLMLEARDD